jgi:hypothetical protein
MEEPDWEGGRVMGLESRKRQAKIQTEGKEEKGEVNFGQSLAAGRVLRKKKQPMIVTLLSQKV